MIWILLFVVFLVVTIISVYNGWEGQSILYSLCCIFSLIYSFFVVFEGISDFAYLQSRKIKIETLMNGTKSVRNAYYKQNYHSKNNIINGSLDNMKQSTNLSKYVSDVNKEKANFNYRLIRSQISESNIIYIIFTSGLFISDKVQDIKPFK